MKLGILQKANGKKPTGELIMAGVKDYDEYVKNRLMWDEEKQCVSLDAEFYEGTEDYLYPKKWLDHAEGLPISSKARTIGVDTAEGGDDTTWAVVGDTGLIEMIARKTPDTSIITGDTIALMTKYQVKPSNVMFDRGGGGKEHADRLRTQGYKVQTVAFGESVALEPKRGITYISERKELIEERYVYKNRRAQMYGILSQLLDPSNHSGFGLLQDQELRRQLSVMPRRYDGEGRLYLPPKSKRSRNSTEETIIEMLGCSPDRADALVLAVYGMLKKPRSVSVGAIV